MNNADTQFIQIQPGDFYFANNWGNANKGSNVDNFKLSVNGSIRASEIFDTVIEKHDFNHCISRYL